MIEKWQTSIFEKRELTSFRHFQNIQFTKVSSKLSFSHNQGVENYNLSKIHEVTDFTFKPVENYLQPVENFYRNSG